MKTFEGMVRINGRHQLVQVQAKNQFDAKQMLEGQYGSGNVKGAPRPI